MANPNPPPFPEHTKWKKGQSGNPGGMPAETHRLIKENAARATRIREKFLIRLEKDIEKIAEDDGLSDGEKARLTTEKLTLMKQAEDRGMGSPKQEVKADLTHGLTDPLAELLVKIAGDGQRITEPE